MRRTVRLNPFTRPLHYKLHFDPCDDDAPSSRDQGVVKHNAPPPDRSRKRKRARPHRTTEAVKKRRSSKGVSGESGVEDQTHSEQLSGAICVDSVESVESTHRHHRLDTLPIEVLGLIFRRAAPFGFVAQWVCKSFRVAWSFFRTIHTDRAAIKEKEKERFGIPLDVPISPQFLSWISGHYVQKLPKLPSELWENVMATGRLDSLKYLFEHTTRWDGSFPKRERLDEMYQTMALHGHLHLLQYMNEMYPIRQISTMMCLSKSAIAGHFHVVEWALIHMKILPLTYALIEKGNGMDIYFRLAVLTDAAAGGYDNFMRAEGIVGTWEAMKANELIPGRGLESRRTKMIRRHALAISSIRGGDPRMVEKAFELTFPLSFETISLEAYKAQYPFLDAILAHPCVQRQTHRNAWRRGDYMAFYPGDESNSTIALSALRKGDIKTLKLLQEGYGLDLSGTISRMMDGWLWPICPCAEAALNRQWETVIYLAKELNCPPHRITLFYASCWGEMDIVQMNMTISHMLLPSDVEQIMLAPDGEKAYRMLMNSPEPPAIGANMCAAAMRRFGLAEVQELRARGCPWGSSVLASAVECGDIDALEWLKEQGCPTGPTLELMHSAGRQSNTDVIRWLRTKVHCAWHHSVVSEAAKRGDLRMIRYALSGGEQSEGDRPRRRPRRSCTPVAPRGCAGVDIRATAKTAILNGHVSVARWAYEEAHLPLDVLKSLRRFVPYDAAELRRWMQNVCDAVEVREVVEEFVEEKGGGGDRDQGGGGDRD